MLVAVTGGTGYLGAHTVRALIQAGHEVKLLAAPTDPTAVLDRLRALGPVTVLTGDVRSAATVEELLAGADALLHAAGVVGTDERRAQLMWDVNAYATEAILTRAVALALDPVVLVSSYSALFPPPDGAISPDSPTACGRSAYAKTKGYADRVARRLQETGAPVVVTYPSSVVGPAFGTAPASPNKGGRRSCGGRWHRRCAAACRWSTCETSPTCMRGSCGPAAARAATCAGGSCSPSTR